MGGLTLLITGAAGYVGRHTVAGARARGHRVTAVVRGTVPETWDGDDGITVLAGDLTEVENLEKACASADVVLHLAASMSGDPSSHEHDTLGATRRLLACLPDKGKLVLLSSIAVYDIDKVAPGDLITERTPLLGDRGGDGYARAKRAQEALVETHARQGGTAVTILRAGAVFGPGRLWNAHLGLALGRVLIRTGGQGQIPLCHVTTCVEALLNAAELPSAGAVNVVDEDLPDRTRFLASLEDGPRLTLPLPWRWLVPLAWAAARVAPAERLPGLLRRDVLRARFLPVSYDNSRMRDVLGVRQAHGFEALMHEAQA